MFLSYAREDADAARRIAEALRGFGIEVWFDQNELRGGDAWDAMIRKRIKECALFLPIISAQTQARAEGYFRREWKLAVDRSHDMAAGRAFIIPVVIDDTTEAAAEVPEEFLKLQWTRLAQGEPTPDFVARVKGLLAKPRRPALKPDLPKPPTLPPMLKQAGLARKAAATGAAPAAPQKKKGVPAWVWVLIAILVISLGVFIAWNHWSAKPVSERKHAEPSTLASASAVETKTAAGPASSAPAAEAAANVATPAKADKSIAVLPFDNMSDNKDNAFFADGVHEDLLTDLTKISDLKVIARTSVMEYRGTTKKIQQIARELGVTYVLEGSVRRAGNKVRIVCQLIDGRTGQHVLAPDPYDRDLADIFAIQSEVAKSIAAKLEAAISPGEKAALDRAPTTNLTAYDLYLKAREIWRREATGNRREAIARAQPLLESALQYDPNFALAWLELGADHLGVYNEFDRSPARAAQAKAALDTAASLDPGNGEIIGMLANYYIDTGDQVKAVEETTRLKQLFPRQAFTLAVLGHQATRLGRHAEALGYYRQARTLDPLNPVIIRGLLIRLVNRRQYEEAESLVRESAELIPPANVLESLERAMIAHSARNDARAAEAVLASISPEARLTDPVARRALTTWAIRCGRADELIWMAEHPIAGRPVAGFLQVGFAMAYKVKGLPGKARPLLEQAQARLAADLNDRPESRDGWTNLALARALLGDRSGALQARQMKLQQPDTGNLFGQPNGDEALYAWLGDKEEALAELGRKLATGEANVHVSRRSLFLQPLQGDPRFEALLADPKNNAPLF